MANKDKEVAVSHNNVDLVGANVNAELPAYMQKGGNRGSEEVSQEDLTIPRLELVQSLSPCRDKKDPAYIEGAEEGILYNNVSRELYGTSVVIIPIIFKKEFLIWKDRKMGGGFKGAYPTMEEANAEIIRLVEEEQEQGLEAVDTGQHLCLLVKEDGKLEEIAISMSRSKAKVSRAFNSLIRMIGGDRFSRAYTVSGVDDKNNKGEKFQNLSIVPAGFPSESAYKAAEKVYEEIYGGERTMNVNADQEPSGEAGNPENGGKGPNF